jgi:hypothetical protein
MIAAESRTAPEFAVAAERRILREADVPAPAELLTARKILPGAAHAHSAATRAHCTPAGAHVRAGRGAAATGAHFPLRRRGCEKADIQRRDRGHR